MPEIPQNLQTIDSANAQAQKLAEEHLKNPPISVEKYNNLLVSTQYSINEEILSAKINPFTDPKTYLTDLIGKLEVNADLKLGIIRTTIDAEKGIAFVGTASTNKSSVVIRDSRLQPQLHKIEKLPNDVIDNYMINTAATARGVIKLIELSDHKERPELIRKVLAEFHKSIEEIQKSDLTAEQRSNKVARMNYEMKQILTEQHSVTVKGKPFSELDEKEFSKVIVNARDFTSFDAKDHPSIISISADLSKNHDINHIESFVPVIPLSRTLKLRYENLESQDWYKDLNPIDMALASSYSDKILDDKHIIPTQLQHLPGVHNYGLSSTFFAKDKKLNYYSCCTRSAAPAYNIATHSDYMQEITDDNVHHIMGIHKQSPKLKDSHSIFCNITNNVSKEAEIGKAVQASTNKKREEAIGFGATVASTPVSITVPWEKHSNFEKMAEAFKQEGTIAHYGCKSGKDRTGLVDKYNNLRAIKEYMRQQGVDETQIAKALIIYNNAWHNEYLAGGNGGSLGCCGLKADTSYKGLASENLLHIIKDLTISNKISDLNMPEFKPSVEEILREITAQVNASNKGTVSKAMKKIFQNPLTSDPKHPLLRT